MRVKAEKVKTYRDARRVRPDGAKPLEGSKGNSAASGLALRGAQHPHSAAGGDKPRPWPSANAAQNW